NATIADLNKDQAILNKTSTETPQQIVTRKLAMADKNITFYTDAVALITEGLVLTIPDYTGLPLIPLKGTVLPDGTRVYGADEVRSYWLTSDNEPKATSVKGRLDRIREQQNYFRKVLANNKPRDPSALNRYIANLDREYDYGVNIALVEVDKDVKFQTGNPDKETPAAIVERKMNARKVQKDILEERIKIIPDFNAMIEDIFGANMSKLKAYQDWLKKQLESELANVRQYHGYSRNPYENLLSGLRTMNEALQARADANRQKRKEQQEAREKAESAYTSFEGQLKKYNEAVTAAQVTVTQQLQVANVPEKAELLKQLDPFFKTMARSPPPVVKKGDTLLLNYEGKKLPLFYVGDRELQQYVEGTFTQKVKNNNGKSEMQWPTSTQLSAFNLTRLLNDTLGFDAYVGTAQAQILDAPFSQYMALGVRLEPKQANLINNLILGYREHSSFNEEFGSTKENPKGKTVKQQYLMLANTFGVSSEDGKLSFGISGLFEISTDQNDKTAGVTGSLSYAPTPRLLLKVESGVARGESKEKHVATLLDVLTGDEIIKSEKLLVAKDQFVFQRVGVALKPFKGNGLTIDLSVTHQSEGVNDAWGKNPTDPTIYGTIGARFNIGAISFNATKGVGRNRTGIEIGYKKFTGYYNYLEGGMNYGVDFNFNQYISLGWRRNIYPGDTSNEFGLRAQYNLKGIGTDFSAMLGTGGLSAGIDKHIYLKRNSDDKKEKMPQPIRDSLENHADLQNVVGKELYKKFLTIAQKPVDLGLANKDVTVITGKDGKQYVVVYTVKAYEFMKKAYAARGAAIFADKEPRLLTASDNPIPVSNLSLAELDRLAAIGITYDTKNAVLATTLDNGKKVRVTNLSAFDRSKVYIERGAQYSWNGVPVKNAEEFVDTLILFTDNDIAVAVPGIEMAKQALRDLQGMGPIFDGLKRVELTAEQIKEAALQKKLYGFLVYEFNGNDFVPKKENDRFIYRYEIRDYAGIKRGIWETGKEGMKVMKELGEKYFVVPAPDGQLEFADERTIVNQLNNNELAWGFEKGVEKFLLVRLVPQAAAANRDDALTVYIDGKPVYGMAASIPDYVIARRKAFDEVRLWLKGNDFVIAKDSNEVIPGAQKVVVLINKPDVKLGSLFTPWTRAELERRWQEFSSRQVTDYLGNFVWYRDKNNNSRYDKGEPTETEKFSSRDRIPATEDKLLSGWAPLLESVIKEGGKQYPVEFTDEAKDILGGLYSKWVLVVNPDFNTTWANKSELADPAKRASFAKQIHKGAAFMEINANGVAVVYYYPNRSLTQSLAIDLTNGKQGASVYYMNKDGSFGKLSHYSRELGVREVRNRGQVIKKFILVQHYAIQNGKEATIRHLGNDAWGMVIVPNYYAKEAVLDLREKTKDGKPFVRIFGYDKDYNLTGELDRIITDRQNQKAVFALNGKSVTLTYDIIHRLGTANRNDERWFGIDSESGDEIIRFYDFKAGSGAPAALKPPTPKAEVDLGEKTSALPEKVKQEMKYTGKEELHRLYNSDANHNILVGEGLQGYSVNKGYSNLHINPSYRFELIQELGERLGKSGRSESNKDWELVREFGIVNGKEVIKIKLDRKLFIISKELVGDRAGAYIVDYKDGVFTAKEMVAKSEDVKDIRSELGSRWDKVREIMASLEKLGIFVGKDASGKTVSGLPVPEQLSWTKISVVNDENPPKPLVSSYQGFAYSESPTVKISDTNLMDMDVVYNGRRLSLRFDLDATGEGLTTPRVISQYEEKVKEELEIDKNTYFVNNNLVIELYKRLVFIEQRDALEKTLRGIRHIRTADERIFTDWKSTLNRLDDIKKNWKVDRYELFPYHAVSNFTWELLSALEIPAEAYTKFVLYNSGTGVQPIQVGQGKLTGLDRKDGHIESENIVIFYRQQTDEEKKAHKNIEVLGSIHRNMWRDFRGNIIMQEEQNDPTAYTLSPNKYGIGSIAFGTKLEGENVIVNSIHLYSEGYKTGFPGYLSVYGKFNIKANGADVKLTKEDLSSGKDVLGGKTIEIQPESIGKVTFISENDNGIFEKTFLKYRNGPDGLFGVVNNALRNTKITQYAQDDPTTYMLGFNKYGIGKLSFGTGWDGSKTAVTTMSLYTGKDESTGLFSFLTLEGQFEIKADGKTVDFVKGDVIGNHNKLDGKDIEIVPLALKNVSLTLKGGSGRLRVILLTYKGDRAALAAAINKASKNNMNFENMYKLEDLYKQFFDLTFIEQTDQINSAYDAGAFHLGYGQKGVGYQMLLNKEGKVNLDQAQYPTNKYLSKTN
ncbi:MAG: hypothetical protein ACM3IL_03690, partial [Deltaproteobacteria bacterium]